MINQPYRLELKHGDKTLSFGPRRPGEVGLDIAAVKIALGSVIPASELPGNNSAENLSDPNGWFDCTTGLEASAADVATFNKDMQSRLMKYQLDNHFIILNYLFRKFGVINMINDINAFEKDERYKDLSNASKDARKESIALQVIEQMTNLFDAEFGELGEATIAVMHGWVPQASLSNKSYYISNDMLVTRQELVNAGISPGNRSVGVVDIIPLTLFTSFVNGMLSQKLKPLDSSDTIVLPSAEGGWEVLENSASLFRIFNNTAPEKYRWQPNASLPHAAVIYHDKPKQLPEGGERTSVLFAAAQTVMESENETISTIDLDQARSAVERAMQPNPFTDPDPFIIRRGKIGFFDVTDFDLQNLFNHDPETIKSLEDKALTKVLQFFQKPEIWYLNKEDFKFIDLYYGIGNTPSAPEHDRTLPHNIQDSEDKIKYWVLTTKENLEKFSSIEETNINFYDKVEGFSNSEPLIKFVEYRTPMDGRPGVKYRAYFEINSHKLDLISDGYRLLDETREQNSNRLEGSTEDNESIASNIAREVSQHCEDLTEEENKRRFKEYRAYAAKNRKEIVRRFREAAMSATQQSTDTAARTRARMNLDLGPLGTYQTDQIATWGVELSQWVAENAADGASALSGMFANSDPFSSPFAEGYNQKITIGFTELKERIKIAKEDLREAQKQAAEERYTFNPKSFDALKEAQNLENILGRIRTLIEAGDPNFGFSDTRTSLGDFLGGIGPMVPYSNDLTIFFDSAPLNPDLGIGGTASQVWQGITIKKIITSNSTVYNFTTDEEPSEFSKSIAIGYLTQIRQMTGGSAGRFLKMSRQVAPGTTFCSDFASPKNGIAYLRQYTKILSIAAPRKTEEDNFIHKTFQEVEKRVADPISAWSGESVSNIASSFTGGIVADTQAGFASFGVDLGGGFKNLKPKFGEDEILPLLGETCNPYLLRQELFNKLSLPGLLCDYLKCVRLPGFDIQIPDFNFPPIPEIPIFGFYTNFVDFILKKFQEIINRIICTFIRTLLQFLEFPFCAEQFKDAFGNAEGFSPIMKEALADALFNLQLNAEDLENAQDFVDNSFRYLRGDEICRLLSGETLDPAAMNMLRRLAEFNGLQTRFSTREDVEEFFSIIAGFVPSTFCDAIAEATSIAGAATCQNTTEALEELRRRMLTGENVTDEELQAAMALAEKNLMDAIDAWNAVSENGLLPMAGQYFALGDNDALINAYPDSLNNSINDTSVSVFQKAKSSYVNSIGTFVSRLYAEVPTIAQPGDDNYDPIAVIRYETALMNLKAYTDLNGDPGSSYVNDDGVAIFGTPNADQQYECLCRIYKKREIESDGGSVPMHAKVLNDREMTMEQIQDLQNPESLEYVHTGWGTNPLLNPDPELSSFDDFLESDVYKEFNTPRITVDDEGLVKPLVDEDNNATLDVKQSKVADRLLQLFTELDSSLQQVFVPKTESQYMAFLKEVYNIALEDARENRSDEIELIGTDIEGDPDTHKVIKMQLPQDMPWRPKLTYQEFLTTPDKSSYTISLSDSHLFPNSNNSPELFEYCEPNPDWIQSYGTAGPENIARRDVFAKHYIKKMKEDFVRYGQSDRISEITSFLNTSGQASNLYPLLYGNNEALTEGLYVKSVEGIMEQMFYSLRDARMFNEEYAEEVDRRIKGRYIDPENQCIINRFNLNHYGILSFDKWVTDEVSDLVRLEMTRPENQPQNLDYNEQGPVEKGIQQAALKGFVRVCMIEIMLKGCIPYSVWDVEGVIGDQFYKDYVARYIISEIEKTESFSGIWQEVAEKIENVQGGEAAIKKMISKEILIMPGLSKDIFDNKDRDYHNWFIDKMPNVDVSSELAPENIKIGNRRIWSTALGEHAYNDPFLSIEHYLRIDGPVADFSNILYDTDRAFQDFLSQMNSVTNEETGLDFADTAQYYDNFKNIPSELSGISTSSGELGFDLSFLDGTGTEGDPLVTDQWPLTEIYSISDVENIFEQINMLKEVFDNEVQPKFGFISNIGSRAHLMAEVIKRTPSRLIKRERTIVTINSSYNNFSHKHEEIIKIFNPGESAPRLGLLGNVDQQETGGYYKEYFDTLARNGNLTIPSNTEKRYYIIPGNGELMIDIVSPTATVSSTASPAARLRSGLYDPLYNVSPPDNGRFPNRGYKMGGLNWNGESTSFTPLDPAAPWFQDRPGRPGVPEPLNDFVLYQPENAPNTIQFQNVYGLVEEESFNALIQEILSPTQEEQEQQEEENLAEIDIQQPSIERWVETVFDFKDKGSVIFSNPGESDDEAIKYWPDLQNRRARNSFRNLFNYISEETDDAGSGGGYLRELLSPAELDPRKLVLGVLSTRESDNANMHTIQHVGPAHSMTMIPTSNHDYDNQVIYKTLENFVKRGDNDYYIADLPEALESLLGPNDYLLPARLLVTQIFDDSTNRVREVFSRIVLPNILNFARHHDVAASAPDSELAFGQPNPEIISRRCRALDQALSAIIDDYIKMIEDAYRIIDPLSATDYDQTTTPPSESEKYRKVMENFKNFPYFIRQPSLRKVDSRRKSFCSVSKIYSRACQDVANTNADVFSNSEASVDNLFADPGFLMKKTDSTDPQNSLSHYERIRTPRPENQTEDLRTGLEAYSAAAIRLALDAAIPEVQNAINSILHFLWGPNLNYEQRGSWGRREGINWFNDLEEIPRNQLLPGYSVYNRQGFTFYNRLFSLLKDYPLSQTQSARERWHNIEKQVGFNERGRFRTGEEYDLWDSLPDDKKDFRSVIRHIMTRPNLSSKLINKKAMAGAEGDANPRGVWHVILQDLQESLQIMRDQEEFPSWADGVGIIEWAGIAGATAGTDENGNIRTVTLDSVSGTYIGAFRNQQKFGLNFLYQPSMNLSGLESIRESPARSNKLALTIANIFHWFDERRYEGFWAHTSRKVHLLEEVELEISTATSQPRLAGPASEQGLSIETAEEQEAILRVKDEYNSLVTVPTWSFNSRTITVNRAHISLRTGVETQDIFCGFSPFLNDDRYHIEEVLDSYKRLFIHKTQASPIQNLSSFLAGYNQIINWFIQQEKSHEALTTMGDDSRLSVSDIYRTLGSSAADPSEIMRYEKFKNISYATRLILSSLKNLTESDANFENLEEHITSINLPISSVLGFPGMSLEHKIKTLFSSDRYRDLFLQVLQGGAESGYSEEAINIGTSRDFYRYFYGQQNSQIIIDNARYFIQRAIQYQHDSWICTLENSGIWYFYQMFQNIFLNALQEQVGRTFSESTIYHCARLLHNTPKEDAVQMWDMFKSANHSEAFGNVSNEERAYMTFVKADNTYLISQPLASYESKLHLSNYSTLNLVNFFDDKREERKDKLIESEDAKKVLEFMFPVRKYMAMNTVFSTSVLGGYGEIPRLLDGAKSSLGMVFLIASKPPRERLDFLSDLSQSEFMKQAMQSVTSDGTSLDCFDFPFNADLLKQFIEELIEIIKQMPSIVLRGIAKQIDPAYQEMRHHWAACDIKNLRNSEIRFTSAPGARGGTTDKLVSGLSDESRRNDPEQSCKYVPLFPAAVADLGFSLWKIVASYGTDPVGWRAMAYTLSRMLSYSIKGPAAMIDLSFAFSIPCLEVDENWGPKFNLGRYGRYGHPMTPITALALATPEINAERELRNKNCSDIPTDPDEQACADTDEGPISGLPSGMPNVPGSYDEG